MSGNSLSPVEINTTPSSTLDRECKNEMLEALSHWRDNSDINGVRLPLPSQFYTSKVILDMELERIFKKEWICAGHISELKEHGDYITFDLVGNPVLIIRDSAGDLNAYFNVCPHRSARLVEDRGNAKILSCPYHAWSFQLNGKLHGAPRMDKEQLSHVCLTSLKLEVWQGLVFVNMDQNAEPLAPRLSTLEDHIGRFNLAEQTTFFTMEEEIACNWKVLIENFCESYHVFRVHRTTLEPYTPTSSVKVLAGGDGYNHHTMDIISGEAKGSDNLEDDKDHLCCLYPSTALSISASGALWLSVRPVSHNRLKYRAWMAIDMNNGDTSEESIKKEVQDMIEFMSEDKVIITGIQEGLECGAGNRGPLNEMEKTNWQHGQYYAQKILGYK